MRFPLYFGLAVLTACSSTEEPPPDTSPDNAPGQQSMLTIGASQMVSADSKDRQHNEFLAFAHPTDPKRMMACVTVNTASRNAYSNVVYMTSDGGTTWKNVFEHKFGPFVGDPACAYANGDTVYYLGLPLYVGPQRVASTELFMSVDGGKTWNKSDGRKFDHRGYFSVDRTDGPHRGTVYFYQWGANPDTTKRGLTVELFTIKEGKFGKRVRVPGFEKYDYMGVSPGVITPDGKLVLAFWANKDGKKSIEATSSSDGGASLSAPIKIAEFNPCATHGFPGVTQTAGVDNSQGPFRGSVYFSWEQTVGNQCVVMLAYSRNGGRTWGKPVTIQEVTAYETPDRGPDAFQPAVGVNDSGVVGVSWYDTRGDRKSKVYQMRFAVSYDGGRSFVRSVPVTTATLDESKSSPFPLFGTVIAGGASRGKVRSEDAIKSTIGFDWNYSSGHAPGDTREMLVNAAGTFYPMWLDNRTGIAQVYGAPIRVSGRATRHGDPSLDSLDDVTSLVGMRFTSTAYDAATRTITLGTVVENRSDTTISGPIVTRTTTLLSANGTPTAINSENGAGGTGARWTYKKSGQLAPWSATDSIPIKFRIDAFDPAAAKWPWLTFETRVYGKRSK
jgi:hypothetical protein